MVPTILSLVFTHIFGGLTCKLRRVMLRNLCTTPFKMTASRWTMAGCDQYVRAELSSRHVGQAMSVTDSLAPTVCEMEREPARS